MTYREFVARLKDFGVAEYKGRGKGGERFFVREAIPGSGKGPSYTKGSIRKSSTSSSSCPLLVFCGDEGLPGHRDLSVHYLYVNLREEHVTALFSRHFPTPCTHEVDRVGGALLGS